ncbi:hypothetical protein KFL_000310020 [Klebsormidium nitens]|uniref:Uncharacterized protein n=1 Tax=Klebsormidium nitens TaxID=105231 RepID=A0A1Y1HR40_KLENI|nr:hypothetical protein KFL_000310020 [Klebsormidium nitens]|eukprot:GAQ79451.1 hypothetical protein KFL_000310020 [Klebsormidium nitens]
MAPICQKILVEAEEVSRLVERGDLVVNVREAEATEFHNAEEWQDKYDGERQRRQSAQIKLTSLQAKLESATQALAAREEKCTSMKRELQTMQSELATSSEREGRLTKDLAQLKERLADEKAQGEGAVRAEKLRHETELKLHTERLNRERQELENMASREGAESLAGAQKKVYAASQTVRGSEQSDRIKRSGADARGKAQGAQEEPDCSSLKDRLAQTEAKLHETERRLQQATSLSTEIEKELARVKQQLAGSSDANRFTNQASLGSAMRRVVKSIAACAQSLTHEPQATGRELASRAARECRLSSLLSDVLFEGFENESFRRGGSASLYGRAERCAKYEQSYVAFVEGDAPESAEFRAFADEKTRVLAANIRDKGGRDFDKNWAEALRHVYALHLLALAFTVPPRLIRRQQGDPFDPMFCELDPACSTNGGAFTKKVAFSVYPGLCLLDEVVPGLKCQVYLEPMQAGSNRFA